MLLRKALSGFGQNTPRRIGEYWEQDNERFEQTQPSFLQRFGRAVNPLTGFGSALGQWSSGIRNGRPGEAALGAIGAIPTFAYTRAVMPPGLSLAKGAIRAPSLAATGAAVAGNAAFGAAGDAAYPQQQPSAPSVLPPGGMPTRPVAPPAPMQASKPQTARLRPTQAKGKSLTAAAPQAPIHPVAPPRPTRPAKAEKRLIGKM